MTLEQIRSIPHGTCSSTHYSNGRIEVWHVHEVWLVFAVTPDKGRLPYLHTTRTDPREALRAVQAILAMLDDMAGL